MKKGQLMVLGVALVAAVGAGVMLLKIVNREPERQVVEIEAPKARMGHVLVASTDIPMGGTVTADKLRWQEWPEDGVSSAFITRENNPEALDQNAGSIARSQIFEGEPIRPNKLVQSDRGFMSAILPKGQRAVATSISTATSAGGFILPNDRVDVLMTRRRTGEGEEGFATEVILQNVRVLAIDQTIQEQDGEPVVVGETATLQLSPTQVEILTVAQQTADRLSLALRSIEDADEDATDGADHLLVGGRGTVRIIRYGNVKETSAPAGNSGE